MSQHWYTPYSGQSSSCAYEAVNEDLKILSQKIEAVTKCCVDSDKLIGTVQHETRNEIENN